MIVCSQSGGLAKPIIERSYAGGISEHVTVCSPSGGLTKPITERSLTLGHMRASYPLEPVRRTGEADHGSRPAQRQALRGDRHPHSEI